ncbi:MAG: hypothetical protein KF861_16555 [Planctomycetaceae bacterium]|nr:hypothetical protein [Planctomycetaceae bacterium]
MTSLHGPTLVEHIVLGVASLAILEQHSRQPEATIVLILISGAAFVFVGAASLAHLVNLTNAHQTSSSPPGLRRWGRWLIFPTVVALMMLSAVTHWPAIVRFHFSRSSFEELVAKAYNGEPPDGFPRRVGLYWVWYCEDGDFDYEARN